MRNNLEIIEKIDNYLLGKLSPEEQMSFEKEINASPELQSMVENQKLIITAVKRKGIRKDIQKITPPKSGSSGYIIGSIIVIAVTIAAFFLWNNEKLTLFQSKKTVEVIEFNGLKTLVAPEVQKFSVPTQEGLTIEGKQGTVVFIPSDAFVDQKGNIIKEPVDFELVEALSLADMVLYNLTTTADGKKLETGGMIYTNATVSGQPVFVNPERPLYIEIPTAEQKEEMMVFTGETTPEGNLNWKNPKPLKKYLALIDFENLDFLPRGFAEKVYEEPKGTAYYTTTKEKVDSLYYTLSYNRIVYESQGQNFRPIDSLIYVCGLEPKTVKALQQKEYSQTYIATKEFEERIHELHKLEYARKYLKHYTNNLEKPLWYADSLVAQDLSGNAKETFKAFARQKLTNVKEPIIVQHQLSEYYNRKMKNYSVNQNKVREQLRNLSDTELNEIEENPKKLVRVPKKPKPSIYSFNAYSIGWYNIDRYVKELDEKSKFVHFVTDVEVNNLKMYQWLNSIKTLTNLRIRNNTAYTAFPSEDKPVAKEMLNTYTLAVSNTMEGDFLWGKVSYNPYLNDTIQIQMKTIKLKSLLKELSQLEGSTPLFQEEIEASLEWVKHEKERRKKEEERKTQEEAFRLKRKLSKPRREFEQRVAELAFPCSIDKMHTTEMVKPEEFGVYLEEIRDIPDEF